MLVEIKRSQLEVGKDYYLAEYGGVTKYKATFKLRTVEGVYFKPLERHPFAFSSTHEGLTGFENSDLLKGFFEVPEEEKIS